MPSRICSWKAVHDNGKNRLVLRCTLPTYKDGLCRKHHADREAEKPKTNLPIANPIKVLRRSRRSHGGYGRMHHIKQCVSENNGET